MKIALCQLNPHVGDCDRNLGATLAAMRKKKADIYLFPELSIPGYIPQDRLLKRSFLDQNREALDALRKKTGKALVVAGFADHDDRVGKTYNAAAVLQDQEVIAIHHKIHLPNYSVFDEKRWFTPGHKATTIIRDGRHIGVTICEDIWFDDIVKRQKMLGADLVLNLSASPYHAGKIQEMESVLLRRHKEVKVPIAYVNRAGSHDGIVYYGHSMLVKDGKIIKAAKDFQEDIIVVDT